MPIFGFGCGTVKTDFPRRKITTEIYLQPGPTHATVQSFEKAMLENDPSIAPSMLYAWACMMEDVPFMNGAPNLTVEIPACDIARKFVRIKETRPDGLVSFEFSIGWPELSVDLMLPRPAFDEFCVRQQVQRLND